MIRRPARGLIACTMFLIATLSLGVSPASAEAPQCSFSAPGGGAVISDTTLKISGMCRMGNQNGFPGEVHSITLTLTPPSGAPVSYSPPGGNATERPFSWQTPVSLNGQYQIRATATGYDGLLDLNGPETSTTSALSFGVEIAPAAPSGVAATFNEDTRKVNVAWKANTESEIQGYAVERASSTGSFSKVGQVTGLSFNDGATLDPGSYRYRVIAIRRGADNTRSVSSAPSSSASVHVSALPVTTTAPPAVNNSNPTTLESPAVAAPTSAAPAPGANAGTTSSGNVQGSTRSNQQSGANAPSSSTNRPKATQKKTSATPSGSSSSSARGPEDNSGFTPTLPYGQRTQLVPTDKKKELASGDPAGGLLNLRRASNQGDSWKTRASVLAGMVAFAGMLAVLAIRKSVAEMPTPAIIDLDRDVDSPATMGHHPRPDTSSLFSRSRWERADSD